MAYPERIRNWWLRVAGNGDRENARCQIEIYTEQNGFQECGSQKNLQVHHLIPGSLSSEEGINPDETPAIVLCSYHHVGTQKNEDNLPFTKDFTFHPDIGEAHTLYRQGNKNAFKEAGKAHAEAAKTGERFWGGDDGSDQHYIDKQVTKGVLYQNTHPDDKKPTVKHQKPNHKPKKHWSDDII